MFLIIGALIFLLSILYFYSSLCRLFKLKRTINKIPGPKTYPIIGNLLDTATLRKDERITFTKEISDRYGPILRLWAGPNIPLVLVSNAEYCETILSSTTHVNKGMLYTFLEPWLGTGLLTASREKWSVWRKILTPALHFSILEKFLDVFNRNALILVEKLEPKTDGEEFDLYPYLYNCTLDVLCEAIMGVKINAQNGEAKRYIECVHRVTESITKRMLNFLYYFDFIYKLTSFYQVEKKSLDILHNMSLNVIRERMKERAASKKTHSPGSEVNDDVGGKKKRALLDTLLDTSDESEEAFSINDIREQVDTFMFEGHDTTSIALAWTIYFVGRNPDVQEKIFEELSSVFGSSDRPADMNDLSNLKYLECVFKESIRLFPPVPVLSRVTDEDITIGDYEVPAGVMLFVNILCVHRDPKYYHNPEKFDPSHFYPDEVRKRHPFAYIPFSAGSRNCIGQKYAMLKQKTILSTFFRKYRVESVQCEKDMKACIELVLRPERGPIVKIQKRECY